ncbi:MAG: MerR family transcriptional regulator [Gammaproteobacteria bacterium]|nr:MerR family transcriptional regulator [Gammaproteobacteria bacterium]
MLNSKELMEQSGISRATLNNYVALGILPSPIVKTPEDGEGRTTRIGYFPNEALDRVKKVQEMKKDGISIAEIANQLSSKSRHRYPLEEPVIKENKEPAKPSKQPIYGNGTSSRLSMELTIDSFPGPAYMVDNNFELMWWNEHAEKTVFGPRATASGDLQTRNLLSLLVEAYEGSDTQDLMETLQPHLAAAKKRMSKSALTKIYAPLGGEMLSLIESLYEGASAIEKQPIVHFSATLKDSTGQDVPCDLYISFYREGILFTYNQVSKNDDFLLQFLAQRNQVIRELLRKRKPYLSHVAVMVADLQNSVRLCSELPAEEYFNLINDIWQESEPIFRKYYGTHGKHAGDGMVYYFFPQPDCNYVLNAVQCAIELQDMMKKITQRWQIRKGWFNELLLNIGLHEGQEWFGTYHAGAHIEFTVLGETVNYASRISDFARDGSTWVTKSMLTQVPSGFRNAVNYGIPRKYDEDDHIFVKDTYANVGSILELDDPINSKFRDIEMIPVTQVRGISTQDIRN